MPAAAIAPGYAPAHCPGCRKCVGEQRGSVVVLLEEPTDDRPVLKQICKRCRRMLYVVATG
jgi:hypothetical protein